MLHLTGVALWFFEISRLLQLARQVTAVVRRRRTQVLDALAWEVLNATADD